MAEINIFSLYVILAYNKRKESHLLWLPVTSCKCNCFKGILFSLKVVAGLCFFYSAACPSILQIVNQVQALASVPIWPGNNHPITQFLTAQFDAGGQKIGPLFAFQRVFVIAGKFYLSRGPDPYLFWTVSHTINIAVWYEPRRSIFPFLVEKIWNLISNSFHCLAFYNGNYGCLSHFLQQCVKRLSVI